MHSCLSWPLLVQDPTWELEHSCVQELLSTGRKTPAALLIGKHLPSYLLASRAEGEQQAFERFLTAREHLFQVRLRKRSGRLAVTAAPGWSRGGVYCPASLGMGAAS